MFEEILKLDEKEIARAQASINLIASENYASKNVRAILASSFSMKYAEGYPGARYYEGCEVVDEIETLAIERAKKLFGVKYANVQPHSGSEANMAAYMAMCEVGDKILAPSMDSGGHLTHGSNASATSKIFNFAHYGVGEGDIYDYDQVRKIAVDFQPKVIVAGTTAYPREIDWKKFREIADEVGAYLLADIAHLSGLIAGGAIETPKDLADVMTSSTHKVLRGPRGGIILSNNEELFKKLNRAVFPMLQGGPHMSVIAAKAQAFAEADSPEFKSYAKQVVNNSKTLASELVKLGCILWSGGSDIHLLVMDTVKSFGLTGKEAASKLSSQGIVVSCSLVPNDTNSPMVTSGARLGAPAMTTRGMKESEMAEVANLVHSVLTSKNVQAEIAALADRFPIDL